LARGPELWSPASVIGGPGGAWNAPGPGTEELALDASPIVARWARRWRGWTGPALRCPNRREQTVPLIITRQQRDAIYEAVINHLTGIGDVWISVQRRDFATAKRLGRAFAEDLRLLEDLGWAETIDRETVALTVPPDELTRTLARLHKDATGALGAYVSQPRDDEELAQRDLAASEALGEVLSQLTRPADSEEASR
jgi:hypothetical protein